MIKLSIIVPIYKVAQYLCKCVDSLLAQDIPASEYEIILVDDGSPDECPQICDEYARMNETIVRDRSRKELENEGVRELGKPFIKVIHRENGGLSAARNSGVEVAQGEYVMFVDSDDYIEPNVLGSLIKRMEDERLDVLRYNYQNVRIAKSEELRGNSVYEMFEPFKAAKRDVDYSESVTDGETFLNERLGPACYATHFIIKHGLIYSNQSSYPRGTIISVVSNQSLGENNILFTPGIYFEDTDWTPKMLLRAKRVASTPMIVYNYLWREGSITLPDNPQKRDKVLQDKISLLRGFKEQSKMVKDPKWFEWMTSFTTMTILGMLAEMSSSERETYLHELKELQIFPLSTKKEKGTNKMKILMANVSPALYCRMMSVIHRV